jgi:hypothetical protein
MCYISSLFLLLLHACQELPGLQGGTLLFDVFSEISTLNLDFSAISVS